MWPVRSLARDVGCNGDNDDDDGGGDDDDGVDDGGGDDGDGGTPVPNGVHIGMPNCCATANRGRPSPAEARSSQLELPNALYFSLSLTPYPCAHGIKFCWVETGDRPI